MADATQPVAQTYPADRQLPPPTRLGNGRCSRQAIDPTSQASRARRSRLPGQAVGWAIGALLAVAFTTTFAATRGRTPTEFAADARPIQVETPGFATSATCRACHPGEYASWHASYHRTMTQVATPDTVIPAIVREEFTLPPWSYRLERRDDTFLVTRWRTDTPQAPEAPRRIVLLTGSHHQQNYWLETGAGRTLEAFPFAWNIHERFWAPVADTFLNPPEAMQQARTEGVWNNTCITCHTTQGRPRIGRDTPFDSQVAEFGIACESCHGEAEAHVARHRNPFTRYLARLSDDPDPTIVNPARLSGPKAALACGQCHSIWAFTQAEALVTWNRDSVTYRPGDATLGERFVVLPAQAEHAAKIAEIRRSNPHFVEDSYWPDGAVRVTGREYNGVAASPCFRGGVFSCLSCHEMHPDSSRREALPAWAVYQMRDDARSDQGCVQCHASLARGLAAHTHHDPASSGSRCLNCHMPHSSFGLLRAVRSHQVSSPTARETAQLGRPNACNLCHLDKPLAWTARTLATWYGQESPALATDDEEIAAGVLWIMKGDAGQRALAAWHLGWKPAQQASGTGWLAPYLAVTLNDPYAAVRFAAWKSLQTLPGFEDFPFDYTAPEEQTFAAGTRAYQHALDIQRRRPARHAPPTLLDPSGRIRPDHYERLLNERDNRRITLVE